jgi:hypothetical protein
MDSSTDQTPNSAPFRPRFLAILCYLSIFGSSWVMMQSIASLSNPEQISIEFTKNLEQLHLQFESAFQKDPAAGEQVQKLIANAASTNTASNMRDHSFFSMVSNLLTLLGAMLMLRLKKNGFRLYLLGTLIGIIAPLLVFGSGNLMGLAFAIYGGIFGLLFVLLYFFKLKYME